MQVVVDGLPVSYTEKNPKSKKTLIILHGWAHHSALWQNLIDNLETKDRIIALDLPGFGNTPLYPQTAGVKEYSEFVFHFIQKQKIKNPIILGHSFGGQIAIRYALDHGNHLDSLILVSPAGVRLRSQKTKLMIFLSKQINNIKLVLPRPLLKRLIRIFTSNDYLDAAQEYKEILKLILDDDYSPRLKDISAPTHIIWGDGDMEIAYNGKLMHEQIPNSTLDVMYGADHNPHLKKATELAAIMSKYL
jgi:pimeloyl-ACP methyl ester carboxylesterase